MSEIQDYVSFFKKVKLVLVLVCVCCTIGSIYIVKSAFDAAEESREMVFVADVNNTLLVALSNDIQVNRPNEAKAVLKRLHHFLFNVTPSASHINATIARAKALSDRTVSQYIEREKEKGWYNTMIAKGVSTEYLCDSISILESDREEFMFKARIYGKTSTIYPERIEFRTLVTSAYLEDTDRTIEEPNGFRVCLWKIESNTILKIFERQRDSIAREESTDLE